jgi:hypothetical protein
MNTRNYVKKIQAQTSMSDLLRVKLVEAHEHMSSKTPYLLEMLNPKLDVKKSFHSTITSALDRAKLLGGEYKIYINHFESRTLLTPEQIEIVRICEEGELDPEKGCSLALANYVREVREAEHLAQEDYDAAEDEELLEMWLEKMDRPGRMAARGNEEPAVNILLREKAMGEICQMSAKEFQTRLLDGTLPEFPREAPPKGLQRDTCQDRRLLTERDYRMPEGCICNYAEAHKDKLRYMSVDQFKQACYEEFVYT